MVKSIKFCCVQPVYINYLIRKQQAQYLRPGRQQQEKRLRELYWEELVVCYGGNCCVQQWDLLCWVIKLSVACDKGEDSMYGHWKILQSRWTVVLEFEWSVLQWTLSGIVWILIKTTGYVVCNILTVLIHSEAKRLQSRSAKALKCRCQYMKTVLYSANAFLLAGWWQGIIDIP